MRRGIAVLLVGALTLTGCATSAPTTEAGTDTAAATGPQAATSPATTSPSSRHARLAPTTPTSDLPTVTVAQLPPEGIDTLALIAAGGPFPFERDGARFQNRERILPARPSGFYVEYTVITPGEDDRGARRIVAGDDGSRFYTADHYDSFREVVAG